MIVLINIRGVNMRKIVLLLILFFTAACTPPEPFIREIKTEEAYELLKNSKDLFVVDVRTKEEYSHGHLKDAVLIPYDEISFKIEQIKQYRNKPILVYCRTRNKSNIAAQILARNGFNQIYILSEGIIGWSYELIEGN
jgi:rhodanese-related sulfurtransferase